MKKNLILFSLFSSFVYSQNIVNIRALDTIFVDFKEDKFQTRFVFPVDYIGFKERRYVINFLDNKEKEYFVFYFTEYTNPDKRDLNIKSEIKYVTKSYLRKNKKKIISINFFKRYGVYRSTYEAFENCKVIYIIDNSENKNCKYTLYEVSKVSSYSMGE